MPLKRKAASPSFSPPAETQFREDDAPLYAAECILDEDGGRASKGKYLIKWAGLDPETGEPWLPSWEPRDGVSNDLIAEWKAKKTLDSSIVGEEGAKFREMLRVKMEKERKKKRAQGGPARKRERKSRETSKQIGSPVKSSISEDVLASEPRATSSPGQPKTRGRPASRSASRPISIPSSPMVEIPFPANSRNSREAGSSTSEPADTAKDIQSAGTAAASTETTEANRSASPNGSHEPSSVSDDAQTHKDDLPPASHPQTSISTNEDQAPQPTSALKEAVGGTPLHTQPHKSVKSVGIDPLPTVIPPTSMSSDAAGPSRPTKTVINLSGPSRYNATPGLDAWQASPAGPVRPIAAPSPPPSRSFLPSDASNEFDATQSSKSTPVSQAEPIDSFSSPVRGTRVDAGNTAGTQQTDLVTPEKARGEQEMSLDETQPRVVKKIIDGEEVMVAWTESMDSMSDPAPPADIREVAEVVAEARPQTVVINMTTSSGSSEDEVLTDILVDAESNEPTVIVSSDLPNGQAVPPVLSASPAYSVSAAAGPTPAQSTAALADAMQEKIKSFDSTLEDLRSDLTERDTKIAQLTDQLQTANRSVSSHRDDLQFLRTQYNQASNRAVEEVRKVANLEKKIETLREQLVLGLKQRDMHHAAIRSQNAGETDRLRAQVKILLDQSRLTDDKVRARGIMYPSVKRTNETLIEQLRSANEKIERLEQRNEDLVDQLELLRAKQMGVLVDDEESSDADSDMTDTDDDAVAETSLVALGYDTRPAGFMSSSQLMPSESQLASDEPLPSRAGEVSDRIDETPTRPSTQSQPVLSESAEITYESKSLVADVPPPEAAAISKPSKPDGQEDEFGDEIIREGRAVKCMWNRGSCSMRFGDVSALAEHLDKHVDEQLLS